MEPTPTVLHPTGETPALWAPGIALSAPAAPRPSGRSAAWAHGALLLSPEDVASLPVAAWVRGVFLSVVSHEAREARVASLCGDRPIFRTRWESAEGAGDGGAVRVAFSVDLESLLGAPLAPGRYHVTASARGYRSTAAPLAVHGAGEAPGSLSSAAPRTHGDLLCQAYALTALGLRAQAADAFDAALEAPALREDLDGAHVYNAACASALAILSEGGRQAEQRLARAWAHLADDLAQRRALLARLTLDAFDAEVERGATSSEADRAAALREATLRHFALARRGDPDLEVLRTVRGFADLFRGASAPAEGLAAR